MMTYNRFISKTTSELQKLNRSPTFDYEESPLLTLEEAVEQITPAISGVTDYVIKATEKFNRDSSLLTRDESVAVYLYSTPSPFFSSLNSALRSGNRNTIKSWLAFLKLFMSALKKLPPTKATVWRGVNYDDTLAYVDNDVHIWWGVNSCSVNINSVQPYISEGGTLFVIEASYAKDISAFSAIPDEQEVVLMPGTRIRKKYDSLNFIDRLFILHLEEICSQSESQSQSNYLFDAIKQKYRENNRIERIMNPAKSFPIEQSYINLAIVTTKEQHEKERQLCQEQHSHGILDSFEQIYGMKTAIEISDIFQTCKNSENQVLVFGRAGIGKSTFCRYVAYQWATNSYWSQYELLALIPLRRLTTNRYPVLPPGKDYSLIDLIKKEVFSFELSEEEENLLKKQFDVKKTLWILDGYDEIIQNIPSHLECLFEQLLKTPHHIITSRPYLNTLLYDVQMEITGFTDDNIQQYVQQFFKQMKDELDDASIKIKNLMNFLQSNGSVWGVAHIPVNLELICSLWSNEDWSEKQELTLTTLYTMMTEWLCRRYIASQNINTQKLSEDEVYEYCQKELIFLESLAFNAMKSNVIIIRPSLLKEALNEAKMSLKDHPHLLNIGLLKAFNRQGTGSQIETKKDHYFIHLSFQEYFAARYLISTFVGSSPEKGTEFIKYQKYNQRYALVFNFIAGLVGDGNRQLYSHIFWNAILEEPVDLVGVRHMQLVISCLEETSDKSTITRYKQLVDWIVKYIQHHIFLENGTIFRHILRSLKRAQSLVCDSIILNMLINLLQNDASWKKGRVLSIISQLKISNLSADLITAISVCLDDQSEHVRHNAYFAVGNIGEKAVMNEILNKTISALEDKNKYVRRNAYYALARMGERAATNDVINKLVSLSGDENKDVRRDAVFVLGQMGEKAATSKVINKFISALEDESEAVRSSACRAFNGLGEKAVTKDIINKLVTVLRDENENVRRDACEVLGEMGKRAAADEVISILMDTLRDENEFVGSNIGEAFKMMGEKVVMNEVINQLLSALENNNEFVRRNACEALSEMGEKAVTDKVINKLVSILGNEGASVRSSVCEFLAKMGKKAATNEVIKKLVGILGDESEDVKANACYALGTMGEKAATSDVINKLMSVLEDESENVRLSAWYALREMGEKAATNEVINKAMVALEDERGYVRSNVYYALEKMGKNAATNEVINKLMSVLGDEDESVRRSAHAALGEIGKKAVTNEIINKLMNVLGNESDLIRESACGALVRIGERAATSEVINKVLGALEDESKGVRSSACKALGEMGEKAASSEVINKLISLLEDDSKDVRESACYALGKMSEKAATKEVVNKLGNLVNDTVQSVSFSAARAIDNILSSSTWITKLGPRLISDICMKKSELHSIKNILGDQLIDMFFSTKDLEWLSTGKQVLFLQEDAVIVTLDKVIVYGRKEPVELGIPNSELRQQLFNALYNQAKQLCLVFDMLPKVTNKS